MNLRNSAIEKLVTKIRILYLLSQYKFEAVTAHSLADAESEGQLPNHCGSPLKSLGKKLNHHSEVPSLLANSQCDWNLEHRGSEQSLDKVYFEVYASVLLA